MSMSEGEMLVRMFPRRKRDEKETDTMPCRGRPAMTLNLEAVQAKFDLPQQEAARALGISVTSLKQVCRKLGVKRWPYHRVTQAKFRCNQRRREVADINEAMTLSDDNTALRVPMPNSGGGRRDAKEILNEALRQMNLPQMLIQTEFQTESTSNNISEEGQAKAEIAKGAALLAALAPPLGLMQGLIKTKAPSPIFELASSPHRARVGTSIPSFQSRHTISEACLEEVVGFQFDHMPPPISAPKLAPAAALLECANQSSTSATWPASFTTLPSFSRVLISTMHDRQIISPRQGMPSMTLSSCFPPVHY
jgi:hypothetical protein